METHRYVRKNLVQSNIIDQYDLSFTKQRYSSPTTTEYWTNGKTTLLSVPQREQKKNQQVHSPFALYQNCYNHSLRETETTTSFNYQPASNMTSSPSTSQNSKTGTSTSSSTSTSNSLIRNSLAAGSVAGMASTLACHPFDVLRVKMQSTALTTSSEGVAGTFRATLQYGGIRALYTGLTLPLAAQAVYKGTVFTVNNMTESAIEEWKTQENYKLGNFTPYKVTMGDRFLCGFMGGAINAALFVTPVEFVRNQLIAQQGSSSQIGPRGPISIIRQTIKSDGVLGLWKGMASTVFRDSVGCGCFFMAMAQVQKQLSPPEDGEPPSQSVVMASGAVAGVAFWLWALPVDTMKTWIQGGTAKNMRHAFEMSQRHGIVQSIPMLFRGWQVAYGRGAPSAAITVLTYSFAYQYLSIGGE